MPENTYPSQYNRWHDQQDNGPPGMPPPPKRSNKPLWIILAALLVVVAGLIVAVGMSGDNKPKAHASTAPTATAAASRAATKAPPPTTTTAAPKPVTIGDGTYEVGTEVKAGTYTTTADKDSAGCYWARLRDFDGGINSIHNNGNLSPGAHGRMVIKTTDKGVEYSGGCVWTKVK